MIYKIWGVISWLWDYLRPRKLKLHDRELEFCGLKCKVQTFDRKDLYQVVMRAGDGAIVMLDSNTYIVVKKGGGDED